MIHYLFILLFCYILQFSGTQAEIEIIVQDVRITFYDPKYFKDVEAFVSGDNGEVFVNVTIIDSLPENTTIHFNTKGASMGEFVIQLGIDYTLPMCDVIYEPILIGPIFHAIGFKENECPPKPGIYVLEDFLINVEQLPDNFYPNYYINYLELYDGEKPLLKAYLIDRIT